MIARVTTGLELLGALVLTAALGLVVHQHAGLVWALVATGLALFAWSRLIQLVWTLQVARGGRRGAA